jgi:hypothetical protein
VNPLVLEQLLKISDRSDDRFRIAMKNRGITIEALEIMKQQGVNYKNAFFMLAKLEMFYYDEAETENLI